MPKRYVSSSSVAASAAASATATASKPSETPRKHLANEPVRVTKLDNGIVVASIENHSTVSRVAAVFNSGARDETYDQKGASHALRIYASLATRNYSKFGLSRTLSQAGNEINITTDREQTTYLLEGLRNNISRGVDILSEIISRPELRHWEIDDTHARFELDLNIYDERPDLRIGDLIHQAAFRNSLSNSLYAPRGNLHHLKGEAIAQYRKSALTCDRLTLVGVGINHDELVRLADLFRVNQTSDHKREQAKFNGGYELREENLSSLVHVAVAAEGASSSGKDALVSSIAAHALGLGGARVKYSSGSSRIERAILPLARQQAAVSTFNQSYSDAGLFGVHVVGDKKDVSKMVKGVFAEVGKLGKSGFSNEEVAKAKNSLKCSIGFSHEHANALIDSIGRHRENPSAELNLNETFKAVDAVSVSDVNAFLKRVASGKHSLAAIGNLSELPRLDELKA